MKAQEELTSQFDTLFEELWNSAANNHGRTLQPWQVRSLVGAITFMDNMIREYHTLYGELPTVVEGEVVDAPQEGQDETSIGVHAPNQDQGAVGVPEGSE